MTKPWLGQSCSVAPPGLSHLGAKRDHHLDSDRHAHSTCAAAPRSLAQGSSANWPPHPARGFAQRSEPPAGPGAHLSRAEGVMDRTSRPPADPTGPSYPAPHAGTEETTGAHASWDADREKGSGGMRKKNYQRYPKPPYSYLAMIAMVIQNSTEKKLTLSEILKEISTLFPFFKGNYKGWRDSVRHNLSSYDCFVKVLKDPGKPQGKGNFWAVELSRVPRELLKRQNTAVSRQDETIFAQDLAPYILHGRVHKPDDESPPSEAGALPPAPLKHPSPPHDDMFRPKLDSSFAIESLLHSWRPPSAVGEVDRATRDCWGEVDPHRPSPPPRPRYTSSIRSASASSASPASSSSEEDWRGPSQAGKRVPLDGEAGSDDYEDPNPPLHKSARRESAAPPWELPTSYAKYTPPNAVAPPSMRFNGGPLMSLHGGLPLYGYGSSPVAPSHFLSHAYWPILPSGRIALQGPPIIMDLDSMLQSVPPNKSVFDVLVPSSQNSHPHHQPLGQYALQNGPSLNRYSQY